MTTSRLEDLSYLAAIIWMPMGVLAESAFLFGVGMLTLGLGLLTTYVRLNKKSVYTEIKLPSREDDTVEFKAEPNDRDHTEQK